MATWAVSGTADALDMVSSIFDGGFRCLDEGGRISSDLGASDLDGDDLEILYLGKSLVHCI